MRRYERGGNAMSRDEFFREMTKRICSTLDIRIALLRSYEFLKTVMPVFVLDLSLYDPESNKETKVANIRNGTVTDESRLNDPLPDGIGNELRNFWASMGEITIFNHPAPDRITNAVYRLAEYRLAEYRHGKGNDLSILVLRLELEGKRIGVLIIVAEGLDRFTEKHADLVAILNEPFSMALSNALQYQEILRLKDMLTDDNRFLHRELRDRSGNAIIGADMGLTQVMRSVRQVAQSNSPVLLLGETGTGKEVIANAIHALSSRKDGPFIKVNCGAIPEGLIDSELFGHEKGAFTGAVSRKRGRFERAERGSIFLDEIGDLPLLAQTRLLRVLQTKQIERVGGTESIDVDVRIICATHRNLETMVASGDFREDLWFRLSVFPIAIPPLRQRRQDIPDLVHHFLRRKSAEMNMHPVPELAPGAMPRLVAGPWRGNVRELENVVERALIQYEGGKLAFERRVDFPAGELPPETSASRIAKLDEAMALHIRNALEVAMGKVNGPEGAAALLGIHPNTLRNRMNKLGISYGRRKKPARIIS
jgi:transcriptional regulator with GAF, ATPase, and Fis domain